VPERRGIKALSNRESYITRCIEGQRLEKVQELGEHFLGSLFGEKVPAVEILTRDLRSRLIAPRLPDIELPGYGSPRTP